MNGRERFVRACRCQPVDRPPVWIMRQAGRYLPEYRALKAKHSFVEMVRTPELACEVTLQPIRRFGFDAAILFSDILVIPEALGMGYQFRAEGGIAMDWRIDRRADLQRLELDGLEERLAYVPAALRRVRAHLNDAHALIGFAGAPWTLATYMIEGGGTSTFERTHHLLDTERETVELLIEILTEAVERYLRIQTAANVDALQLFDSWASACPERWRRRFGLAPVEQLVAGSGVETPVILYARGQACRIEDLASTGAQILGIDETFDMADAVRRVPDTIALQGNLDPALMSGEPAAVVAATRTLLTLMNERAGHIVNLGHGIRPDARIENVEALIEAVRSESRAS
jgi:uroporphyrinogen decarboxylase